MPAALGRRNPHQGLWPLYTENVSTSLVFSEQNLERQVLQTQCRRLEAQHYSLSLTAEQLSHSMAVSLGPPHVGKRTKAGSWGVFVTQLCFFLV